MTPQQSHTYEACFEIETLLRVAPCIKRLPGYAEKFQAYTDAVVATEIALDFVSAEQPAAFLEAIANLHRVLSDEIDPWLFAELRPRAPHAYKRYQRLRARVPCGWGEETNRAKPRSASKNLASTVGRDRRARRECPWRSNRRMTARPAIAPNLRAVNAKRGGRK